MRKSCLLWGSVVLIALAAGLPQRALADGPYKVSKVVKVGGEGTFDTAFADVEGRRLYIPRKGPGRITVFDLDTLEPARRNPRRGSERRCQPTRNPGTVRKQSTGRDVGLEDPEDDQDR